MVFAAINHWKPDFVDVRPLLQATNPSRFTPSAGIADAGDQVLFVGSTRGVFRPIVKDAMEANLALSLYGVGWQEYVEVDQIKAEFLANDQLPHAYASAHVVLNDHHQFMADTGFLSNRLFDAAATGARIISDPALGLSEVFGDHVRTYSSVEELAAIASDVDAAFPNKDERMKFANEIAEKHSFTARAKELIAYVKAKQSQS